MPEAAAERDERRRVLDLLERGAIGADDATALLRELGADAPPQAIAERGRILGLLEEGILSVAQALTLLRATAPRRSRAVAPGGAGAAAHIAASRSASAAGAARGAGIARTLRITVDASETEGKDALVRVNVPLGLARFAGRFLPADARVQLEAQGIDLTELLDQLGDDLPEGPLVDIDVEDGASSAKILIEVV